MRSPEGKNYYTTGVYREIVPPERASPLALRQRAMRNGQLEVRFRLQSGQSTATRQMVRAVYHGAKSSFRYAVVGLFIPRHREFGRLEVSRSLGYWKAAAGLRQFEEYRSADADSHGRVSVSAGEVGAARHRPAGD